MKKFIIVFFLAIVVFLTVTWFHLPTLFSLIFSKDFNVPVKIEKANIQKKQITFLGFTLKNKSGKTKNAMLAKKITINFNLGELFAKIHQINSIVIEDIDITLEYLNKNGSKNNWSEIISTKTKKSNNTKQYLIKSLVFKNLTITEYKQNGSKKTYPKINKLEMKHLTQDSGFPISQIEKAIFNAMMKSIFQKLNIKHLIQLANPVKLIPNVIKAIPIIGGPKKSASTSP